MSRLPKMVVEKRTETRRTRTQGIAGIAQLLERLCAIEGRIGPAILAYCDRWDITIEDVVDRMSAKLKLRIVDELTDCLPHQRRSSVSSYHKDLERAEAAQYSAECAKGFFVLSPRRPDRRHV